MSLEHEHLIILLTAFYEKNKIIKKKKKLNCRENLISGQHITTVRDVAYLNLPDNSFIRQLLTGKSVLNYNQ